jgi:hypothetical protein
MDMAVSPTTRSELLTWGHQIARRSSKYFRRTPGDMLLSSGNRPMASV